MITSTKLKTWTLLSHALIVVGAGHGIMFFFLIEIITFPYIGENGISFSFNTTGNHFPIIGLTTLLGQVALTVSILLQKQNLKNITHIAGLCLLWLGIVYFIYDTTKDSYTHIVLITVIPFAICTIITFLGKTFKKLYDWIIDK